MEKITEQNLQAGLPFVEAKHYRKGRRAKVRVLVIHTAETPENNKMAESIQAYCARRADNVSCHEAIDNDSVVAGVRPYDTAWTTGSINDFSYSYELAGRARQTKAEWADEFSTAMLKLVAKRVAKAAVLWKIPVVKLSPAELKAGRTGICGHVDQTVAYEVKGGHTDPGPNFPWLQFLDMVKAEVAALTGAPVPPIVPTVPVAPVPPAPAPAHDCAKNTVKKGSKGECVKTAQTRLIHHGFEPGPVDGVFGPKTQAAVRYFQETRKLKVDGIVGPAETWPALLKDK
jgi:N-acetyl-anhydromuramyl-L-alanine amidase AmpD